MNRRTRLVTGGTLLAAGAVAAPIPVVPGFVLVAAGLGVLAPEVAWANRLAGYFPDRMTRRSSQVTDDR